MKKAIFLIFIFAGFTFQGMTQIQPPQPGVGEIEAADVLPSLKDIPPVISPSERKKSPNKFGDKPEYPNYKYSGSDPVWQSEMGSIAMSTGLDQNFAGQDATSGLSPSDDNGDVGPNHYVQTVNATFEIFDKTGNSLYGPADVSTVFTGISGGNCNSGDPIVLYDEDADRWLISQFSTCNPTKYMHIAISQTPDPTGGWVRYAVSWGSTVPDYPKFGIWRDSYLLALNCGTNDVVAFDRSEMLAGVTTTYVQFDNPWRPNSGLHTLQPLDNDGTFAPFGSEALFITINDDAWSGNDELWIYELDVDWSNPGSATFDRVQQLGVASFDSNWGGTWDNIPQPGTSQKLELLSQILMYRAQYRNFGSYETMVCCHDVDVSGSDHAGIRWYELRRSGGNWSIHQQGTYAPDSDHRWMGSISMNGAGQIALAYSVASSSVYPSIRYTGRNPGDPAGQMTFAEASIWEGTQSQTNGNRWGDYSSMSVDPSDDETFWYTTQYAGGSAWNWHTRIASFRLSSYCTASGGCSEHISNVQMGSIDNSSGCDSYADYTSLTTNLPLNAAQTLTVTNGVTSYPGDQCGVWVDWNDDGDFNDANETISVVGTPGIGPYTAIIDPPTGTSLGEKVMRIRITWTGTLDPCGSTSYGEVEDYTINVTSAVDNQWTGAVDSDWENTGNWTLGHAPTSDEDIVVPGGTPNQPIIYNGTNAYCRDMVLQGGAVLTQNGTSYFRVHGDFNTDNGQFTMTNSLAYLYFDGDNNNTWDDDNENDTYTSVRVDKNVSTAQTFMWQNMTVDNSFEVREGEFKIDAQWTLQVNGTSSFAFQVENGGKVIMNDEAINVVGGMEFEDGSQLEFNGGWFRCGGDFRVEANTGYDIIFNAGSLTMNGSGTQYIEDLDGGTLELFTLVIDKPSGTCYIANEDLDVDGIMSIQSGTLSCKNSSGSSTTQDIYMRQHWYTYGPAGFEESTGRVIFDGGNFHQYCGSETFNELEVNKPSGGAFRVDGNDVVCAAFDWTAGAVDVLSGSFTANDLIDNGIYGSWYTNPGGTINITNNDGYVDLNGSLTFTNGGTINVHGGTSNSFWSYAADASVTMNGGVLDFHDRGIRLYDGSYTLTTNISGGTIRTASSFYGDQGSFMPTGGTVECYTTTDGSLENSSGNFFHNLVINKSSKSGSPNPNLEDVPREGEKALKGTKANTMSLISDLDINGDLFIDNGTLNTATWDIYIAGDWSNSAGPAAFAENNNQVVFDGGTQADVNTDETFYNMVMDKTETSFQALEIMDGTTVSISNNLNIMDGGIEMNNNSTIQVSNNLNIANNAGLNMFGDTGLELYVGGNWTNNNTTYNTGGVGFAPGMGTVNFNGANDQTITTSAPQEEFYNVVIDKSGNSLQPADNLWIYGNLDVFNGGFGSGASGLNHYLFGDVFIASSGDMYPSNTVTFKGTSDQTFEIQGVNNGYFNSIVVDKTAAKSAYSPGKKEEGPAINYGSGGKAQTLTLNSKMISLGSGNMTVEEGTFDVNSNYFRITGGDIEVNDGGQINVGPGGFLQLEGGLALNVNNGGTLELMGAAGNEAMITRNNAGNIDVNIFSGGTIAAEHSIFEYTGFNGVYVNNGAFVDVAHPFDHCLFRNGPGTSGSAFLVINNNQNLTITGAHFPDNGSTSYNVAKDLNQGNVDMVSATGVFAGEDHDFDPHNRVNWTSPGIQVDLKAWLEGPFNGSDMNTTVNTSGNLPLNQPFDADPAAIWYYTGAESVGSIPNNNVVDWILVELRDAANAGSASSATTIATQACFILDDGAIVGLDGGSTLSFNVTVSQNLFAVVWHRNHLGIMSASALTESGGVYSYDYTTGPGQVYGGANGHKEIDPGVWGMVGGDGKPDGQIGNGDKNDVWAVEAGSAGYLLGDFNLDTQVSNTDKNVIWVPNSGAGNQVPAGAMPEGFQCHVPK